MTRGYLTQGLQDARFARHKDTWHEVTWHKVCRTQGLQDTRLHSTKFARRKVCKTQCLQDARLHGTKFARRKVYKTQGCVAQGLQDAMLHGTRFVRRKVRRTQGLQDARLHDTHDQIFSLFIDADEWKKLRVIVTSAHLPINKLHDLRTHSYIDSLTYNYVESSTYKLYSYIGSPRQLYRLTYVIVWTHLRNNIGYPRIVRSAHLHNPLWRRKIRLELCVLR